MAKKAIVINKKYFQDGDTLYLFAQLMKEENNISYYLWKLYRNDYGTWHSFMQDANWTTNQQLSEMDGIEILKGQFLTKNWTSVNYAEPTLMIVGNTDLILAKEKIIDLIKKNLPDLIVKFI